MLLLCFEGSPTLLVFAHMKGNNKALNANLRENVTLPPTLIARCVAFNYPRCRIGLCSCQRQKQTPVTRGSRITARY